LIGLKELLMMIIRAINYSTIKYWLLIGNIAGFFYYPELITRDIDIAVLFDTSKDIETFIHSLENVGFTINHEQRYSLMSRLRTIITVEDSPYYIDLLPVVHDREIFMDVWIHRTEEDIDGYKLPLPTFEYWIILKLYAGREEDFVVTKKAIQHAKNVGIKINMEKLQKLAEKYGIQDRLAKILRL